MAEQTPASKDVPTRLLDWAERQGALKIIWAPISFLAAVGGILLLAGNNWLTFFAIVGSGTACLSLILYFLQHYRTQKLQEDVTNLQRTTARNTQDLRVLEKVADRARWATERLNACCSDHKSGNPSSSAMELVAQVRANPSFSKLEPAVLDCCQELLKPLDYRLALYYGSNEYLESLWPIAWTSEPPIYTCLSSSNMNQIVLPHLFNILREPSGGACIQDVDNPSEAEKPLLEAARDKHQFKYFACYAISTVSPVAKPTSTSRDLLGALSIQITRPGPLNADLQQHFFPLLANVLAAGYLTALARVASG